MRTLQTQVKLRRLIRSTAEAFSRLRWQPAERRMADAIVDRLLGLAAEVRESWAEDALSGRPGEALSAFMAESLRMAELAISGAAQEGSDLELLRQDFERAALPLEVFLGTFRHRLGLRGRLRRRRRLHRCRSGLSTGSKQVRLRGARGCCQPRTVCSGLDAGDLGWLGCSSIKTSRTCSGELDLALQDWPRRRAVPTRHSTLVTAQDETVR